MNRSLFHCTVQIAAFALSGGLTAAHALSECTKFGNPSYVAERTSRFPDRTVKSKVYAKADIEREEIDHGGKTEVILMSPQAIVSYFPDMKIGMKFPPPPEPPRANGSAGAKQPHLRMREESADGNHKIIFEIQDSRGQWLLANEVTCRSDGALLARKSRVPMRGKVIETSMTQTIVSVGPIDSTLFDVPADIKFRQPGPPPKR